MSKNLHLQFKFTDRGGQEVFEIFDAEDNAHAKPLGTLRMTRGINTVRMVADWLPTRRQEDDADADDNTCPEQLELDV